MQRLLALVLIVIGVAGLVLGRLGETTWAPETETTATVDLSDAGPAVVIDPGVLYVGGEEGELVIEGASDVSVITAGNGDIDAYLEDVHHTRITGASDWTTLSTQEVNPDGADELTDPTASDLWRTVETAPSPYTLDVAEFWAAENGEENEQPYRALLIVTDGTAAGAETVSITWPVDAENEWVPFAYAGGAAIAVIGLVLLVVSLGGGRRRGRDEEEIEDAPQSPVAAGAAAGTATIVGGAHGTDRAETPETREGESDSVAAAPEHSTSDTDVLPGAPAREDGEKNVWSFGGSPDADGGTDSTGTATADAGPADADPSDSPTPRAEDPTEQIDAVDDEEGRR